MQASVVGYDIIIRRRERRGEKEFRGTGWERRERILSRLGGVKVEGFMRF